MNTNDIVLAIAFGASLVRMKGIAVTAQSAYGCAMIGQYSSKVGESRTVFKHRELAVRVSGIVARTEFDRVDAD